MSRYDFVYLASQSPRRAQLLEQIGVRYKPLLASDDEDIEALEEIHPRESARHYVQRVCVLKAGAALVRCKQRALPAAPILVADTTVAVRGAILGKPDSRQDATRMLRLLSGSTHQVLTAVALITSRRLEWMLNVSLVTMRALSEADIRHYVASGEPEGKAGAYAMQGRAAAFVTMVRGSHSGIVGLPLAETAHLLKRFAVAC